MTEPFSELYESYKNGNIQYTKEQLSKYLTADKLSFFEYLESINDIDTYKYFSIYLISEMT